MPSATKDRKSKGKPRAKGAAKSPQGKAKAATARQAAPRAPRGARRGAEVVRGTVRPTRAAEVQGAPQATPKTSAKKAAEKAAKASARKKPAKPGKAKAKRKKASLLNATNADRYDLYQRAVNSPEADVDFLIKVYERFRNGRRPRHLREDFCGTANLAAEWLRRGPEHTAEGFDLDPEPIAWGKRHNFADIADVDDRMTFHLADVRSRPSVAPDVTTAPNFSYWCLRTRAELKEYFRSAYEGLAHDGVFVIDVYGGPESIVEMEEQRDIDGKFTYVWDQQLYWPGTGEYHAAIHFRFDDGSELRDAFHYLWRFWNLPELRDLLAEVGFQQVTTWFEGTDPEDDEAGDGVFELDDKGENCQAWIGYVVAVK